MDSQEIDRRMTLDQIKVAFTRTNGQAWSPPSGRQHPVIVDLVERGWLCHCVMRCGFEAFDDGIDWTEAARAALASLPATKGASK